MRDVPLKPEGTAPPGNPVLSCFENLYLGEGVRAQINVGIFLLRLVYPGNRWLRSLVGKVLLGQKESWSEFGP